MGCLLVECVSVWVRHCFIICKHTFLRNANLENSRFVKQEKCSGVFLSINVNVSIRDVNCDCGWPGVLCWFAWGGNDGLHGVQVDGCVRHLDLHSFQRVYCSEPFRGIFVWTLHPKRSSHFCKQKLLVNFVCLLSVCYGKRQSRQSNPSVFSRVFWIFKQWVKAVGVQRGEWAIIAGRLLDLAEKHFSSCKWTTYANWLLPRKASTHERKTTHSNLCNTYQNRVPSGRENQNHQGLGDQMWTCAWCLWCFQWLLGPHTPSCRLLVFCMVSVIPGSHSEGHLCIRDIVHPVCNRVAVLDNQCRPCNLEEHTDYSCSAGSIVQDLTPHYVSGLSGHVIHECVLKCCN